MAEFNKLFYVECHNYFFFIKFIIERMAGVLSKVFPLFFYLSLIKFVKFFKLHTRDKEKNYLTPPSKFLQAWTNLFFLQSNKFIYK